MEPQINDPFPEWNRIKYNSGTLKPIRCTWTVVLYTVSVLMYFFFLQDKEDKISIRYLNILKIYYTFPI